jgi:hypothetical protein
MTFLCFFICSCEIKRGVDWDKSDTALTSLDETILIKNTNIDLISSLF